MLEELRALLPGTIVRTSDCLGPCSRKDVLVVQPSQEMRMSGSRPVWLGWLGDRDSIRDLAGWVLGGGPGQEAIPDGLAMHEFAHGKRARSRERSAGSATLRSIAGVDTE